MLCDSNAGYKSASSPRLTTFVLALALLCFVGWGGAHAQNQIPQAATEAYIQGNTSFRNQAFAEAATAYQIAADLGLADAQFALGYLYEVGRGVKWDSAQAVNLYTKAANQGHAQAQIRLGFLYEKGGSGKIDHRLAFYWYERAAQQGVSVAQTKLGMAYYTGRGVDRDEAQGVAWLQKAARQGEANAQAALTKLHLTW